MNKKRKILLAIVLILAIAIPMIVYAQMVQQAECCRLSQNIVMNDVTYGCSNIKYPVRNGMPMHCTAFNDDQNCHFVPDATTFFKNTIVGAGDCLMADSDTCELKGETVNLDIESHEWGTICLLNSIYNLTNWVFFFFLAIAIFIGVLAGYQFMTAAGDPGKVTKARDLLLYMAIGLIIAAIAKIIPTLVRTIVGF